MEVRFHPDVDERLRGELTRVASRCFYGNGPPYVRLALPEKPFDLNSPLDPTAARRVQTYQFEALYRGKWHVGFLVRPA
ncbi:hypothetical protein D3C71_1568960 [compost metagenome]